MRIGGSRTVRLNLGDAWRAAGGTRPPEIEVAPDRMGLSSICLGLMTGGESPARMERLERLLGSQAYSIPPGRVSRDIIEYALH